MRDWYKFYLECRLLKNLVLSSVSQVQEHLQLVFRISQRGNENTHADVMQQCVLRVQQACRYLSYI